MQKTVQLLLLSFQGNQVSQGQAKIDQPASPSQVLGLQNGGHDQIQTGCFLSYWVK